MLFIYFFSIGFVIPFTLQLKNNIFHFSKEVSLSSSDFNIIITKPKKISIQYHTEQSISHLYSNITPVNENPFFFLFALRISWTFIYPNENGIYGRIYIPPSRYYKCNARDCSLSLWERISIFFFYEKRRKKCLRGVWNEEKSIVV